MSESTISLRQIEEMFTSIREQTNWNIDGDMLWSYFFFDADPDKLIVLGNKLTEMGYVNVDVYQSANNTSCVLHVSKVETHSAETLFNRNKQFCDLANRFGVDKYDGMDVGPAE